MTQSELARRVWYSSAAVAKVEKAQRWPTWDLSRRCDQVLRTGGALALLWPEVDQQRIALDGRRRHRLG